MRCMILAVAVGLLLSGPALGAAGDVLTVIGDRVNVRSGPGTEHPVSRQLSRDQRLLELERRGDWVHAEIAGESGGDGWIHGSLVAPSGGGSAVPHTAAEPVGLGDEAAPARPLDEMTDAAGAREAGPVAPEAIAPDAGAETAASDLQRFRDSVAYLNSRSMLVGGFELFTEVEPLGRDAVQIIASEGWANIPPAGQRSYAVTLLDRWAAATGRSGAVRVQIVDDSGQILMEQSRP